MDNSKRNIGVIIGITSFTVSMVFGLLGDMRLITMLTRSFACFAISIVFSLFVIIAIEKFTNLGNHLQTRQKVRSTKSNKQNETEPKTI